MPFSSSKKKYSILKKNIKKAVQFQHRWEHIQKNQIQIAKIVHMEV